MQAEHHERLHSARTLGGSMPTEAALAELAPHGLAGGAPAGGGLLGLAGTAWSLLPSEAQRAIVLGALWQAAAALESAWHHIVEASKQESAPAA